MQILTAFKIIDFNLILGLPLIIATSIIWDFFAKGRYGNKLVFSSYRWWILLIGLINLGGFGYNFIQNIALSDRYFGPYAFQYWFLFFYACFAPFLLLKTSWAHKKCAPTITSFRNSCWYAL